MRKNYYQHEIQNNYNKKEIWIINDKQYNADDNGEYFFRFLKNKNPEGIKYYFSIKKDCLDYERLKTLGDILEFGSNKHLNIFLKANKVISSVAESWAYNPFGVDQIYIRDLLNFSFILIQSGFIENDLYKSFNRIYENLNFIIVSSNKEYKAILNEKYVTSKNKVLLTGLPKYDNLLKLQSLIHKERIILIIPNVIKFINGFIGTKIYSNKYSNSFNLNEYFNFYNNLINNNQLLQKMKKLGFVGFFCLNPYFSKHFVYFKQNQIFSVLEKCNYQNLLLKSSLLVTDYSNYFFDFAYLKKPIIYTQFDYEHSKKYSKIYFDYNINGFGPVCYNLECTINKIISNLENNCNMKKKYLRRINSFFKYTDGKNCDRLLLNLLNNSAINFEKYNKEKTSNKIIILMLFSFLLKMILKFINIFTIIIYN